jgi:hypothetical protein
MSLARTLAARLLSALLIVATLAAGHQHRLLAPASDALTIERAKPAAAAKAEASDCAVCRALHAADTAAQPRCGAADVADATVLEAGAAPPASPAAACHSPRGPPAQLA